MVSLWLWCALITTAAAYDGGDSIAPATPQINSRKERFLLSVLKFHNARCDETTSDGRRVEGVCQHRAECKYLRGSSLGTCAIFGTCCAIERSCNNATSLKVAYFVSPPPGSETYCDFRVDVINRHVCQIRLDMEEFSIAQPAKTDPLTSTNPYVCDTDEFVVRSLYAGADSVPALCGENAGQHMYVPVNSTHGANSIVLSFRLATRATNLGLLAPRWRIKITQIECGGSTHSHVSHNTAHSSAWNKQLPGNDNFRRAPPGCLQYYTERTGTYETFNYMGGVGPYISNLNYAICFRREADVCGIRHTPVTFSMAFNTNNFNFTNDDCVSRASDGFAIPNQDYLYVPEGFTSTTIASKYCGFAANSTNFITSVAPGPMLVFFRSDNIEDPDTNIERGFRINYEVLNRGC